MFILTCNIDYNLLTAPVLIVLMISILVPNSAKEKDVKKLCNDINGTECDTDISQLYLINNEGCKIAYMEEFSYEVQPFWEKAIPINCNDTPTFIEQQGENGIYIKNFGKNNVSCCYSKFERHSYDVIVFDDNCLNLENDKYTEIKYEFIRVTCRYNENTYKYLFNFISDDRLREIVSEKKLDLKKKRTEFPSVLIVGLDSLSRLNFYRQMPKTVRFLKEKMQALEMLGYNKVGENTFPNLRAILMGLHMNEELENEDKLFIWSEYNDTHIIGYGEDTTELYHYDIKNLFADFSYNTFDIAARLEIGNQQILNGILCLGNELRVHSLLDYTKRFAKKFKEYPYFGFFWGNTMTHDYLNHPQLIDDHYYQLLYDLHNSDILKDSILLVLSDHGLRWGSIRQTYQGFLEEQLPLFFISTPKWFQEMYPLAWNNIQVNSKRLITSYDIHEFLVDLKNLSAISTESLQKRNVDTNARGISLFLPISSNRTCTDARIPMHYCACRGMKPIIDTSQTLVKNFAEVVVRTINGMLKGYENCALLNLKEIKGAMQSLENDNLYMVHITTTPGDAMFEASIQVADGNSYNVENTISRLNAYGKQSRCIEKKELKLYCYCK